MGTLSPALHEEEPGLVGQAGELPKGVEEGQQVVVEGVHEVIYGVEAVGDEGHVGDKRAWA